MKIHYLFILFLFFPWIVLGVGHDLDANVLKWTKKLDLKIKRGSLKKENFENIKTVQQELQSMSDFDQSVRKEFINSFKNPKVQKLILRMDIYHTDKLKCILALHGWITISKFGEKADQQAWLLVQHADHDLPFQASTAFILQQLVPLRETSKRNYAYLYDRVALRMLPLGVKQKYGTQVAIERGQIKVLPYEGTLQEMDKRRQDIGLEPIDDYINLLKKTYVL